MLTPLINFGQVLDAPGGRAVLEKHLPTTLTVDPTPLRELLVGALLPVTPGLRDDDRARAAFWADIDEVMAPILLRPHPPVPVPVPADQASPRSSAPWRLIGQPTRWGVLEIALTGPDDGNPFVDVDLSAEFVCGDQSWVVGGFYDGDGIYRLRVLAEAEGSWSFVTSSTAPALDGVRGEVVVGVARSGAHGPVRVDGFHFAYADGSRYRPWGTTAYAWNHQCERLQAATLATLAGSAFTKLRMCLFPKHFVYNHDEPRAVPVPP